MVRGEDQGGFWDLEGTMKHEEREMFSLMRWDRVVNFMMLIH